MKSQNNKYSYLEEQWQHLWLSPEDNFLTNSTAIIDYSLYSKQGKKSIATTAFQYMFTIYYCCCSVAQCINSRCDSILVWVFLIFLKSNLPKKEKKMIQDRNKS